MFLRNTFINFFFAQMKICLIAARTRNSVIGKSGLMPWHLPADLKWFKEKTKGHHVLMGRVTFESIGKALPNRTNILLTRNPNYSADGVCITDSWQEAKEIAEKAGETNLFVIGGAEIYRQLLPLADMLFLTEIDTDTEGDAFFPEFDESQWEICEERKHLKDEKNPYDLHFKVLEKKKPQL
jgi:dihydrofolate reductase